MAVTVFTIEDFAESQANGEPMPEDGKDMSQHSDEMSDGGNEFSSVAVPTVDHTDLSSTIISQRAPSTKLNQIGVSTDVTAAASERDGDGDAEEVEF